MCQLLHQLVKIVLSLSTFLNDSEVVDFVKGISREPFFEDLIGNGAVFRENAFRKRFVSDNARGNERQEIGIHIGTLSGQPLKDNNVS
jgi:hypothetical protein